MDKKPRLGEFLKMRRSQLQPADVGLPDFGERRRVPGLRRDELAQLAGVGLSYYTRLEQGLSLNASPEVLDALARALGLDEVERAHLHDLARASRRTGTRRRPAPERAGDTTRQLLGAFGDAPAILLGRRSDVLAWNRTGHALFAGHLDPHIPDQPDRRPNTARLVFLDAHTRDLYVDWPKKARDVVGKLRLAAGQHPDDPRLAELIGELTMKSSEFAMMWSEHRVRKWDLATYRMHHPLVGHMQLNLQTLNVPQAEGQRLVVATADAGTASAAALTLLAQASVPTVRQASRAEAAESTRFGADSRR
ncbi:transcriptional regulator with XRE-family HTH domain [Streptomyces griseochromogenes]|uniref:Transcriptional regulator n=1 Tax=Streptomyces griseochromogenes TaxID=68214 RepID=A0A1B1AV78_9ACTN|nr:helix-turn-helix transcriptional regulator [Streptomyces griseochromogenes]ANP50476.1 transcriptional regulator [Streptomyces griseochromogenes]MBP2051227.1 transcriptional regulator with XRE-family HTH domain [Streptomyces griseochromogenes]